MNELNKPYEKYRWFFTSSGKLVMGGKSAEQNEELMSKVGGSKGFVVMHTAAPGSPFCIIKTPNKQDLQEVAVFTACFGQDWKRGKKESEVHIFESEQIKKAKGMKQGTFGILGKPKNMKVKLELALDFQKGKLRALPISAAKKPIAKISPGNLTKDQASDKIAEIIKNELCYPIKKDEIMAAIPSDKISIKAK